MRMPPSPPPFFERAIFDDEFQLENISSYTAGI